RRLRVLDDVQLFILATAATAWSHRGLRERGRAGQLGRHVGVAMRLELVGVTTLRRLAKSVHRVLVGQDEDRLAVGVGAARKSRPIHIPHNAGGTLMIPPVHIYY